MKKTLLLSALTFGLLLSATNAQAKSDTKTLVQKQVNESKKAFKQAPKEILEALKDSSLAMQSLQNKKNEEAKKYLQAATEKFDKALKDNPDLDILPLEQSMQVYENLASTKEIKEILSLAKEYIDKHQLDAARASLAPLKDEIDISTLSIPMKLFPIAAKNALNALNKGDAQAAVMIMAEGYSGFMTVEVMIPLPLLTAQDMIVEASMLDKSKKEDAQKLLDAAKDELKRAEVLGYTESKAADYQALNDAIDAVKKEIKGKNAVEKFYDKLKSSFEGLVHKSKTVRTQKKAEAKVNAYESNEADKATKDVKKFHTEAVQDKSKTVKK